MGELEKVHEGCVKWMVKNNPGVHFFALDNFKELTEEIFKIIDDLIGRNKVSLAKHGFNMTMASEKEVQPHITTGMLGFLFLTKTCEHIQHYGFFYDQTTSNDCEQHYWEKGCRHYYTDNDTFHKVTKEHILWAAISEAGRLRGLGNYHTHP
eukprot:gnl/MRDRNA2_/MRDRNA2_85428_c0_seq2.p1 gnl/MRDRNA2_/MRDRNA2_85428_c0~~gnl/MRDRNA2_/MRDRNA2_85428_c0_seq2.p1  ORF type:complete len:152 (+),score=18.98 gnl/MRDRNA2_/MRDRNA2_85428_c0_seq2:537-992(+)